MHLLTYFDGLNYRAQRRIEGSVTFTELRTVPFRRDKLTVKRRIDASLVESLNTHRPSRKPVDVNWCRSNIGRLADTRFTYLPARLVWPTRIE